MIKSKKDIVDRIVKALGITKSDLAKKFNVSKGAVHSWCINGIPSEHCAELESLLSATEDPVKRTEMRPDDWHKWWPDLAEQEKTNSDRAA